MIYEAKEFTLKNGLKVIIRSPEVSESLKVLNNVVKVAKSTHYLLSAPEDYDTYYQNIKLEEDFISSFYNNKDYKRLILFLMISSASALWSSLWNFLVMITLGLSIS